MSSWIEVGNSNSQGPSPILPKEVIFFSIINVKYLKKKICVFTRDYQSLTKRNQLESLENLI